jgi:plasmid stability protein
MIRINLLPKKRKAPRGAGPGRAAPKRGTGGLWLGLMLLGWAGLAAAAWWVQGLAEEENQALRTLAAAKNKEAEQISKEIDEEGLEASKRQLEEALAAREALEKKSRTPMYVMYELAMIVTPGQEGGGPTIDEEKRRQLLKQDAANKMNERWDPTGLWLRKVEEKNGTLLIEGSARDATDLSEFTRRLRLSERFGSIKHPDFQRVGSAKEKASEHRHLDWTLDVAVRRWD